MKQKAMLIILDGWGLGTEPHADAIQQANTPYVDDLYHRYPNAVLTTHGREVGLPEGQMGNSEVGHLNIGAGRIVYQDLAKINIAVSEGTLEFEETVVQAIDYANRNNKKVHILGLLSDGGVHSNIEHILSLSKIFSKSTDSRVIIHAFMDGRDTDPQSGLGFIQEVLTETSESTIELGSIVGRYYAMDRDNRWERIKLAYDLLVHGTGKNTDNPLSEVKASYENGLTDEFILPISCGQDCNVEEGDLVVFANFRTDRPRQLVRALTQESFPEQKMKPLNLYFVTMTNYDETFQNVHVIYKKDVLKDTLGEVLAQKGLSQLRIAETEKYPHVTFFFSGGLEAPFPNEERILVPSPKVATYDMAPEMSANEVTQSVLDQINQSPPDFICLNYANADMVGHTGVFNASIKAVETVDGCLARLIPEALNHDYDLLIIADHGNSDFMINQDGTPNTAHTTNPVPVIYISNSALKHQPKVRSGILADIAPTILSLMQIDKPDRMTGRSLIHFTKN